MWVSTLTSRPSTLQAALLSAGNAPKATLRHLAAPAMRAQMTIGVGIMVLQQFSGINAIVFYRCVRPHRDGKELRIGRVHTPPARFPYAHFLILYYPPLDTYARTLTNQHGSHRQCRRNDATCTELAHADMTTLPKVDISCTALSLMPTVNGNTVRSFSTHGQQSAAKGSSTTVSRSDIRLILTF
jgi:hypothetical protein